MGDGDAAYLAGPGDAPRGLRRPRTLRVSRRRTRARTAVVPALRADPRRRGRWEIAARCVGGRAGAEESIPDAAESGFVPNAPWGGRERRGMLVAKNDSAVSTRKTLQALHLGGVENEAPPAAPPPGLLERSYF